MSSILDSASRGSRTAKAASLLVLTKICAKGIDFVALLIFARYLGPAEFGVVAVAMTVVLILESVFELPLAQALVRLPELKQDHYDTAFTLGLLRGICIALIFSAVSYPLSKFNSDARLIPLLCVLGFAPAFRGMVSPRMVDYVRNIDFRRDLAIEIIGKVGAVAVAIPVVLLTRSYWALAINVLLVPMIMLIASYVFAPYRPRVSFAAWKDFSSIIGWNSISQLMAAVNWQVDRLMLGRYSSKSEYGRFAIASDLAGLPYQVLVVPMVRPFLAAFATLAGDVKELLRTYLKGSGAIVTIAAPILGCAALFSEPLVNFVLGEKWSGASEMLRWLAVAGIAPLAITPFNAFCIAAGNPRLPALSVLLEFMVKVPATIVAVVHWGLAGVLFVRVIVGVVATLLTMVLNVKYFGIKISQQLGVYIRPGVSVISMAVVGYSGHYVLLDPLWRFRDAFSVLVLIPLALLSYVIVLVIVWRIQGSPDGIEAAVSQQFAKLRRQIFKS